MSILIKGMEMPINCRDCHLKMNCDDCEGYECVCVPLHQQIGYLDDLLTDKRRDDCPLVPVPPHGRLIDADALTAKFKEMGLGEHSLIERLFADGVYVMIDYAPTIIPASEEGEA